jgi:hypothetical protein
MNVAAKISWKVVRAVFEPCSASGELYSEWTRPMEESALVQDAAHHECHVCRAFTEPGNHCRPNGT